MGLYRGYMGFIGVVGFRVLGLGLIRLRARVQR